MTDFIFDSASVASAVPSVFFVSVFAMMPGHSRSYEVESMGGEDSNEGESGLSGDSRLATTSAGTQ